IIITEIGGTVGDIESFPFVEAVRQLKWKLGNTRCITVHLTLIPYLASAKELKTKPTQHSVKMLLESGLQADILVCRTEYPLNKEIRRKLALFCNVNINAVIEAIDVDTIYDVPLSLLKEGLDDIVLSKLRLPKNGEPDLTTWKEFLSRLKNPTRTVRVGLVGKYVELQDAYKSILESFIHAGAANECKVDVVSIQSDHITSENVHDKLKDLNGVLVAPGFGDRGIEGKITAIQYVREHNIPFFGICLGMQCSVIEFGRNVLHLKDAHSTEMNPKTKHPVIDMMEEQKNITEMGGTMRLGSYDCRLYKKTKAFETYRSQSISERHRHRYEFNNDYLKDFEAKGMTAAGINPQQNLVEIVELKDHPWFVGVQFHPELKSKVDKPHPLFVAFIKAAIVNNEKNS
ncbi:MAG: CTP synthetase, partial [Sphingobacteriales bacterium BACL12 MAG-120802-bin5]